MTLERFHLYRTLAMVLAGGVGALVGAVLMQPFQLSPSLRNTVLYSCVLVGPALVFFLFRRVTVTCTECHTPLRITRRFGLAIGYWCDSCERDPSAESEEQTELFSTSIYDSPPNPNHLPQTVAKFAALLGMVVCYWYFNSYEVPVDEGALVWIWLVIIAAVWGIAWGITRELTARKCPKCGGKLFYQKRGYQQKLGFRCRSCKHFIDLRSDYDRNPSTAP
ncbi:hypothetical protein [Rubinisphaera margarita]|uniref:hypothetical protein n=1 Tax=Rubinisphaera margarita TaxID=2909586 RepID=UPI001EE83DD3|nr:hypothetical protein [Rubinisphaera margarita]MCG6158575.1 hypothetical protein [Rubinisphaera margarita]